MKKLLLLPLLLLALSSAQLPSFTPAEVAVHNIATDCWIIFNNQVYNVTSFIPVHPGGRANITAQCGKDGTAAFNAADHAMDAITLRATFLIGNLVTPPPPPATIAVTISPTSASVVINTTQKFDATITNSALGVTFSVTGDIGTVDSTGLFTATTLGTGTVVAQSVEDGSKTASATVTVVATPSATVQVEAHADHFARHPAEARKRGRTFCATCHGTTSAGGTAAAHADRAFPSPATFSGPAACYVSPWGATGQPATDPYGDRQFPALVCTKDFSRLAVFNQGTKITCAQCHGSGD